MKIDIHVWIKTFLKPWPDLMWLDHKVVLLSGSASACEHLSIQGWIHSKRRNRLGQDLVQCLVRTHTNLDHRLDLYETGMFPWDLEMTVGDPLSDDEDEDGVSHLVPDSESESENDSD
jgi:hypothetical protein